MTREEVIAWAGEQMQKTFDGKRWKFSNTAEAIAIKAFVEGIEAGYEAATQTINASEKKLSEVFPGIDLDDYTEPNIVALNMCTGKEAVAAWDAYSLKQSEGPAEDDDGIWLLYYMSDFDDVPRPYFMGTLRECTAQRNAEFLRGKEIRIAQVAQEGF